MIALDRKIQDHPGKRHRRPSRVQDRFQSTREPGCVSGATSIPPNLKRYQRVAPLYDLLDLPFEYGRYQRIRPQLFYGLTGHLLDAGIGTGRNVSFYPKGTKVTGIDISPAMLHRAERRARRSKVVIDLKVMDVIRLDFPADTFDAAVGSFLFCVVPDCLQVTGLRELTRVVKPNGIIRLLEYVRPHGRIRSALARFWEPWMAWVYGASFDRHTEQHISEAGLEIVGSSFIVNDLIKLLTARVPPRAPALTTNSDTEHKNGSSKSE